MTRLPCARKAARHRSSSCSADSVRRTEPIDIKKPNVAPDDSMYCDRVARAPRGPGPALGQGGTTYRRIWKPPPIKPIVRPTSEPIIAPIVTA